MLVNCSISELRHSIQLQRIQVRGCRDRLLSTPDFSLWGFVKEQVYRTSVRDLSNLQDAAVTNVTPQMHHNTWVEVVYRLDNSRDTNRSHVEVCGT